MQQPTTSKVRPRDPLDVQVRQTVYGPPDRERCVIPHVARADGAKAAHRTERPRAVSLQPWR